MVSGGGERQGEGHVQYLLFLLCVFRFLFNEAARHGFPSKKCDYNILLSHICLWIKVADKYLSSPSSLYEKKTKEKKTRDG